MYGNVIGCALKQAGDNLATQAEALLSVRKEKERSDVSV